MITILHRGGQAKWLQYYIGRGGSTETPKSDYVIYGWPLTTLITTVPIGHHANLLISSSLSVVGGVQAAHTIRSLQQLLPLQHLQHHDHDGREIIEGKWLLPNKQIPTCLSTLSPLDLCQSQYWTLERSPPASAPPHPPSRPASLRAVVQISAKKIITLMQPNIQVFGCGYQPHWLRSDKRDTIIIPTHIMY